jgi:hypothetical protein
LESNGYIGDVLEVLRDVNLVWDNCYLYNELGSWIVENAKILQKSFIKKMYEHKDNFTPEELDLAQQPNVYKYHPQEKPSPTITITPSLLHSPTSHPKHKPKAIHTPSSAKHSNMVMVASQSNPTGSPVAHHTGRGTRHSSYRTPPLKPNLDEILDSFEGYDFYICFVEILLVTLFHLCQKSEKNYFRC